MGADADMNGHTGRPPRDHLFRAVRPGVELRAKGDGGDGMPTLEGHFAVFNEWTEIDSIFEGTFMERIAPGAFKKTFKEQRDSIRCLFQHGMDFNIGDKPLGPVDALEEDKEGARYEVPLLDTSYVRDILPGLEAKLYGASFRFRVIREDFNEEPDPSDENPRGLPERTITELECREFGPVTFPAYPGATAQVRSVTDQFVLGRFAQQPERTQQIGVSFTGASWPGFNPNTNTAWGQPVVGGPVLPTRSADVHEEERDEDPLAQLDTLADSLSEQEDLDQDKLREVLEKLNELATDETEDEPRDDGESDEEEDEELDTSTTSDDGSDDEVDDDDRNDQTSDDEEEESDEDDDSESEDEEAEEDAPEADNDNDESEDDAGRSATSNEDPSRIRSFGTREDDSWPRL
jgi:HK97 family phage prohead protease